MYILFLLDSSHNSPSVDFSLLSIHYQYSIMIRLRRKSLFSTTVSAPNCPQPGTFGIAHYQRIVLECPFPKQDFDSWKSYYTTGTPKFTMADNHCEYFKATHDSCKIRIHREIQHRYFTPQENTEDFDKLNHQLNHKTREK